MNVREAAERRAEAVGARRGSRPQQRRAAERDSKTRGWTGSFAGGMTIREASSGDGMLEFGGSASVYNRFYDMWDMFGPYEEQVASGAGAVSLARLDLSVPLVIDHEPIRRLALTTLGNLKVYETPDALRVEATLDPADPDVAYAAPKVRSGLLSEMSFRFMIEEGEWNEDYTQFSIVRYDIHKGDVSIVGYGANPYTSGAVRSEDTTGRIKRAFLLDQLQRSA